MSQFFDQASLVMVPSGYKNGKVYSQKPLSADGELTFTRSNDTATRVGPDGLIEKVRTNLVTYSNDFSNAAWNKANVTLTAGQPDKDGGTNAWRVQFTGSSSDSYIYQDITNQLNAGSIYVKGTAGETALIGVRTSVGGGALTTFNGSWQRVTDTNASNGYFVISDYGSATATDFLIMNAQVEAGDIATDYIATTTAAVSVGPVANLPRLDYSGGATCPKLLLEPQSVNLALFSESFDNAGWQKTAAGTGVNPAVTANYATSPSGYQDADLIVFDRGAGNTGSDYSWLYQNIVTTAATYSMSCYVKAATSADVGKSLSWRNFGSGDAAGLTLTNEWQRVSVQATGTGISQEVGFYNRGTYSTGNSVSVLMWGFQAELGAYATSYINTLGAAVTRGADGAGTSDVFGTTYTLDADFGLYWEGVINGTLVYPNFYSGGNYASGADFRSYLLYNGNTFQLYGVSEVLTAQRAIALSIGTYYKILVKRVGATIKWYVNGTEYANTTGYETTTVKIRSLFGATLGAQNHESVAQALIFQTTISDAQGIELTTI